MAGQAPTDVRMVVRRCVGLILLGWGLTVIDVPLSKWFIDGGLPGDVRALFQRVESFGHTYGLVCIAITIYLLDPIRRQALAGVIGSFILAGLSADLLKLTVWRLRPRAYWELGGEGTTFVGSIWTDQRQAWTIVTDHAYHSFPSAHTACAVALAYQLGRLYPQGRNWFFVLAALCAMNRIDGGAHFASDVCWGAALGLAVARGLASIRSPVVRNLPFWVRSTAAQRSPG